MTIARELNPLDAAVFESENYIYMMWRKYGEAERRYNELLRQSPDFYKAYSGMGRVLAAQGRYKESIEMLGKARALAGDAPSFLSALGQVHGMNGNRNVARRMLDLLREIARRRHVPATRFALVHLGLGERGEALEWLERGCERHELPLTSMGVHPAYDDLRGEPRFKAILEKMGLESIR